MQSRYGNYTHAVAESNIEVSNQVLRNNRGVAYAVAFNVTQFGAIHGDTQSELIGNMTDLIDAYSVDNKDFVFQFPDGTASPDITLNVADSFGGVKVVSRPSLNKVHEGQYSTFWEYRIQLQATMKLSDLRIGTILEFNEEVETIGNGDAPFKLVELKNARADKQRPRQYSICTASQSGTMIMYGRFPSDSDLPRPIWPDDLEREKTRSKKGRKQKINGVPFAYPRSYSYSFARSSAFPSVDPNEF